MKFCVFCVLICFIFACFVFQKSLLNSYDLNTFLLNMEIFSQKQTERCLYVICNSHMDPVWLWRRTSGRSTWLNTIHAVVQMMKRHAELKFSCSSTALYRYIEECSPALFEEIRNLVSQGKWEIVGGWEVQSDAIIADTESLLRQALVGKEYIKKTFGVDVKIGFSADAFGHSANLPKILAATGFSHYVFLRPNTSENKLPPIFDWRAEDGSQVRTLRIFDAYNYENCSKEEYFYRIEQHVKYGLPRQTLFFGTGDHGGGIYESHYQWLLEAADKFNVNIKFSTLQEYFDDVANEKIPIVENTEIGPVFRGCYAACQKCKSMISKGMQRLEIAEKCGAEEKALADAWKEILHHHFHDELSGTATYEAFEEDVYPALGSVIWQAENCIDHAIHSHTESLDTSFLTEGGVFLWNPQHTAVNGIFSFPGFSDPNETGADFNALIDRAGRIHPLQIVFLSQTTFGPCASHWGQLTACIPMDAGEEKVLAFTRMPSDSFPSLGFAPQYKLLEKISFPCFHDDTGTWGFTLTDFIRAETTAERIRVEEIVNGPVCSMLRAFYKLNDSEIRLDIWQFLGIDELKLSLRIDWHEKLRTLKMAIAHGFGPMASFYTGTSGGEIVRLKPAFQSKMVQIVNGRQEPLHPRTGEVSMLEWCAAFSKDDNHSCALFSGNLHSCDLADGCIRMTIIRSTPYADHHPFQRNEETGFMDMGLSFRELWFSEATELPLENIPSKARRRLHNIECVEITGHAATSTVSEIGAPKFSCPDSVVVESARKTSDGKWELHFLNHGGEISIQMPDASSCIIPAKGLKIVRL